MLELRDIIARNVVESLPVGLLIVDQAGAFITVNPAAAAILGYARSQLLGRGWGELFFDNEANDTFNQVFMDVIQKELVGLCREVPYVAPDGEHRLVSLTTSYLQGEDAVAGVVVILHDMTELSRMQRRETEILKEINKIQEEKIRGLNRLAASVAHQIRNPAFAIGGFASRLARQLQAGGLQSEYPSIILEEARRLENLVKAVGRFASLGSLHLEDMALGELFERARALAVQSASNATERKIRWQTDLPQTTFMADPGLLSTALAEVLRNALEYAGDTEIIINVGATTSPDTIRLTVTDNGPGVSKQDGPHIFDPFYSSRPDGIGMGLPLAQEILLEHNGQISLDADYGPGARFVLSLPRFPRHLVSRFEETAS